MNRRNFIKKGLLYVPTVGIFVPSLAQAASRRAMLEAKRLSGGGGGGGCTTEAFAGGTSFDDAYDWAFYTWQAQSFTTVGSFTVCKAQAYLAQQGTTAAGTLEALIYTESGSNTPGTLVGTGSGTVDRTTIPGSQSFIEFTGMSASLSAATTYWLILKASAIDANGSNRIFWQVDTTGETGLIKSSVNGTVWDATGTNRTFTFKLFS